MKGRLTVRGDVVICFLSDLRTHVSRERRGALCYPNRGSVYPPPTQQTYAPTPIAAPQQNIEGSSGKDIRNLFFPEEKTGSVWQTCS